MKFWNILLLSLLVAATPVAAAGVRLNPHPRLYINGEAQGKVPGVDELKARVKDPRYAEAWKRLQESSTPESIALVYLLTGDTTRLDKLRGDLGKVINRPEPLTEHALAYDWAWQAFSAEERALYAGKLTESAAATLKRYPMDCVYHNYSRSPHMGRTLAMLAAWDDDPAVQAIYPEIERKTNELLEILADGARLDDMDGRAGWGGGWPEGYDYDRHGGFYSLQTLLAWRSAGLGDHFTGSRYWRDKILWLVYGTSPDGSIVHGYEDNDFPYPLRHERETLAALGHEYDDGHAAWWLETFADTLAPRPYWEFIFRDMGLKPAPPADLPTGRLIPGVGLALMRSSWERDASFVAFHCGPWYTYHQHAAQGSFTAWRGMPLVIEPGVYDGEVHEHYVNWRIRSISHNCLTVFDPEELYHGPGDVPNPANDGGQIIQNWTLKPGNMKQWREQKNMRATGEVTLFLNDRSHDMAAGEAAGGYAPGKVGRWSRQLLFVKPGWLVVCDLVRAKAEFPKTLYFHSQDEVSLQGGKASGAGAFSAFSLLPAGAKLNIAGGPGKTFAYGGNNWTTIPAYNHQVDTAWRLEVGAPQEESSVFLTAIYLPQTDESASSPKAELVSSGPERVTLRLDGKYEVTLTPGDPESYSLTGPGVTYCITGVVTGEGLALEGRRVQLSGPASASASTDSHGAFLFQGLAPGDYTVTLADGGQSQKVSLADHSVGGVLFGN